jgi:peptidoglycan/LPS O-acetylase OafA/YrhL
MQMIVTDVGVFARVFTFGVAAFLIVAGVVLWSPEMKGLMGRLLVVLGNASYSTYLISSIAIEIALRLLLAVRPPHSASVSVLYALVCVATILAAGWLFYNFVEWPLLRFLKRRMAL